MKLKLMAVVALGVLSSSTFAADAAKTSGSLTTDQQQLSYVFGLNTGTTFRAQHMAVDQAAFEAGLKDGVAGTQPALSKEKIRDILTKFQKEMVAKREAELKKLAETNKTAGDAYRADYAKQKGVVSLDNGETLYKIITPGKGALPKLTDNISVTYDGKLIDGTVFDSTKLKGGKPVSLPLSHMIPGMQEALLKMPVGSTWEIVVAPKKAYGEMGVPTTPIGPNATLVFDMTLVGTAPAGK